MARTFRNTAIDPTRWSSHGRWDDEATDDALRRTASTGQRFFTTLFARHPALVADAFFLRWSQQPGDTYLFVDRDHDGFGVQYDPDLDYVIVSGADGRNEVGPWFADPADEALRYVEATYLRPAPRIVHHGSCLCGAVTFDVEGALPPPDACHCTQCRKHSGHYFVSTDVPRAAVTIRGEEKLAWYRSSEKARRGFCATCGSSLFWDPIDRDKHSWIGVAMGAFDGPTDTRLRIHIHVAEQGDYYDLADGLPQNPR